MAGEDTVLMVTPNGKKYNVPKSQIPAMTQKYSAKVYTAPTGPSAPQFPTGSVQLNPGGPVLSGPPTRTNRLVTSFAGVPEATDIDPTSKGFYAGTVDFGNYLTALKQAITSLNPVNGDAASTALTRMKQPGVVNKVTGAVEYPISGVPYVGPMAVRAMEQGAKGDIAGSVGSSVAAGLGGAGLARSAPALAENLTPTALANSTKGPLRSLFGVGKTFEKRMAEEHRTALTDYNAKLSQIMQDNRRAVDEARQTHEQAVANVQKQNAEAHATYQEKVNGIRQKYAEQFAAKESGAPAASASQSGADVKRSAMGDSPRSGPVFQRLQGMTNQVYGMIDNLQDRIRSEYNRRWRAFDTAVDEAAKNKTGKGAEVNWTPVQQAVKDAEQNILQGSPESIAIFRNIMKESPQLDEASVFRSSQATEAAQNLKEVLGSRFMDEATKKRIEAQLHSQGVSMAQATGTENVTPNFSIPFADARGYLTELGSKLSGARLPGDVYRAIKHVLGAADTQVAEPVKAAGQESTYGDLRNDYKIYKQNFDDPEAAIYQFDKLDTPEKRVDFLASGKGQNLIDSLSKYKGFGSDPGLPGRVRSLVRQIRDLPASREIPGSPERPSFPKPPEFKENPEGPNFSKTVEPPDAVEPLDITRKRVEQLENMAKSWSQFTPNQARWLRSGITQRSIGSLLSNPNFRAWLAGAKQ